MNPLNALSGRRNRRIIFAGLVTWLTVSIGWADVAVLREKGPWSGSIGSNIGLLAEPSPPSKITMVSAEVKVHLRRGTGDELAADCTADFVLEDRSDPSTGPQEFLVAFPVTGLNSKIVTVDNFAVQVQGEKPALVFRQAIVISKWQGGLKDLPLHGQLEARFQAKLEDNQWGVALTDERLYPNAYVWPQKSTPGTTTRVRVTYTATLRPQTLRYSKSYQSSLGDGEVIPFADVTVENWDEPYYFFDYVLMSGSTWDGPIGRETIQFSIDPELGISTSDLSGTVRRPVGRRLRHWDEDDRRAGLSYSTDVVADSTRWIITGKPEADILFSIPVSAIGRTKAVPQN